MNTFIKVVSWILAIVAIVLIGLSLYQIFIDPTISAAATLIVGSLMVLTYNLALLLIAEHKIDKIFNYKITSLFISEATIGIIRIHPPRLLTNLGCILIYTFFLGGGLIYLAHGWLFPAVLIIIALSVASFIGYKVLHHIKTVDNI